jgi:hypothetical protein
MSLEGSSPYKGTAYKGVYCMPKAVVCRMEGGGKRQSRELETHQIIDILVVPILQAIYISECELSSALSLSTSTCTQTCG